MAVTDRIENPMVMNELWHDPEPVLCCDDCGADICREDYYYNIGGDVICENCINDYIELNFRRNA